VPIDIVMDAVVGAVSDNDPNTIYIFVVGIWSWIGVPRSNEPEPETAVSDCLDPSGDSMVDDGVRMVTTFSVPRPNNVACAILFIILRGLALA